MERKQFDTKQVYGFVRKEGENKLIIFPALIATDGTVGFLVTQWADEKDKANLTPKKVIPIDPSRLSGPRPEDPPMPDADFFYRDQLNWQDEQELPEFLLEKEPENPGGSLEMN